MGRNWSELLPEMLEIIASKCMLLSLKDFVMVSCVCCSWNKAGNIVKSTQVFEQQIIPWLMLSNDDGDRRNLFDLSNNKCYNVSLPETYERNCLGTGSQWILMVGLDYEIRLLNPLTRASLPLPSYQTFRYRLGETPEEEDGIAASREEFYKMYGEQYSYEENFRRYYISRALVQEEKESRKLLVVVIYGACDYVAAAKPEDSKWTHIEGYNVRDIAYCPTSGLTLFMQGSAFVSYCDLRPLFNNYANTDMDRNTTDVPLMRLADYAPPSSFMTEYHDMAKQRRSVLERFYLVESFGDILIVLRTYHDEDTMITDGLQVYKLDLETKEWEMVSNLGDLALFVGNSPGVSVKASCYPCCNANSIYFNDDGSDEFCYWGPKFDNLGRLVDNVPGGWDMGVCDLANLTVEPFYHGDDFISLYSVPIWLLPPKL